MSYTIYVIENTLSGGVYVGKAGKNPRARWIAHMSALRLNKHHNRYLQRVWNKHGEAVFAFRVLRTYTTEAEAFDAEQQAIAFYRTQTNLPVYNMTDGGDGVPGHEITETKLARLSASSQQRWQDAAQRERTAEQVRQRFQDPEERRAQSERIKAAVERMKADPEQQAAWDLARAKKSAAQQRRWADPEKRAIAAEKQRAVRARQRAAKQGEA